MVIGILRKLAVSLSKDASPGRFEQVSFSLVVVNVIIRRLHLMGGGGVEHKKVHLNH